MKTSDPEECVLCCGEILIYAIGECDHPVCYQCSARMRVLCETNECPICRTDMPMVVWTSEEELFSAVSRRYSLFDKRFQITFENTSAQKAFNSLLENSCDVCEEKFSVFDKLSDHVRKRHDLHYCDLCTENLKVFPYERKTYNRKDLARHKRIGDPDDTSHRGHPLCQFCDQRYIDTDELFRHLRREHYFCHFCDADGNHEYYEDYDYLRVHFRKEHYLCEEGDCANEQFTGVFRTDIDLKAHIAVQHSKNKSKAEARQARMLEFDYVYAHPARPSGNSSPRSGRFHQQRRHNIEGSNANIKTSREPVQQLETEKINTTSTLEFPYLSEDSDSRSNNVAPIPKFNSVTMQSCGRQQIPLQHKKGISPDDFPALTSSASINSASEGTNNQSKKFNSVSRPSNALTRNPSLSVKVSQSNVQPKSNLQGKEKMSSNWAPLKKNFEDDFPKLETKKLPATHNNAVKTNVVNTASVNNTTTINTKQNSTLVVPIATHVCNGDQFVTIKAKSKKKHRVAGWSNNKVSDVQEDDLSNLPNILTNRFNALDQENKDPFRKNLVRTENSSRNNYIEEPTWQKKVSFGQDDFPPLAPTEVIRKPPGFNAPKKKTPPPGFNSNTDRKENTSSLNITLSAVAQQLASDKNKGAAVPESNFPYTNPPDIDTRNKNLVKKIEALCVYNEFKTVSGEFIKSEISASSYYNKCFEILGEVGFNDIFPELIALLPSINKQQELLDVHRKNQNRGGAVPKQKSVNNNQIAVCDICYQVLVKKDVSSHLHD